MKIGDQVKWAAPMSADEAKERFTVVEVNGDRCVIEFNCNMSIKPTQVAMVADLVVVQGQA